MQGAKGIPKLYWFGTEGEYNIMVIELLGPNLEALFKACNRHFSLPTALSVAQQMVLQCGSNLIVETIENFA